MNVETRPVDDALEVEPPRRFRWHHLYYALAGFDLVTILATLVLGHIVMGIFVSSVEVNQTWARRLEEYGILRDHAANSNAPGNRLFSSGDVDLEEKALNESAASFYKKLAKEQEDLRQNVDPALAAPLLADLLHVEDAFDRMVGEARLIFSDFRNGAQESAGTHMTQMDEGFYEVGSALNDLERGVRKIQFQTLEEQSARADSLRKYELLVAFVVVLILAAVTRYGHLVSRAFSKAEETNRRQLAALRQNQIELDNSRRSAEQANLAKSQFLANMSHEIRTPMTSILGFAENCLDANLGEKDRQEAIGTILRNGDHLLRLINDILDLSKIEAGQLRLERIRTSTVDLFEEARGLMAGAANKKGLAFEVEYRNSIPETIETDPTRLRQALINLIGNAIKFSEKGEVRVIVQLVPAPDAGSDAMLEVQVVDTGIGIDPKDLDRLFVPFTQADNSMTRRFGGTGLGLTISRQLCRELGGDLAVASTPGEGSRFTLTVSTGALDGVRLIDQPKHFKIRSDRAPQPTSDTIHARILVAEDGIDNQQLIAFILRKAGAEVVLVENGKEAVDAAMLALESDEPFDLILMDMQMPVLDGYSATGDLRSRGYTRPIVALTAHAMADERERCLAAGCDEYASKPIDRRRLLATISQALAGNSSTGAGDSPKSEGERVTTKKLPSTDA